MTGAPEEEEAHQDGEQHYGQALMDQMDGADSLQHQGGSKLAEQQQRRSAKEEELLQRMREKVASLDPQSTDTDDATLLRFLRARSMDGAKSAKMFAEHQRWRRSYVPQGSIQEKDVKDELDAKKFFLQGHDRKGRPITVVLAAKHICSKDVEQYKRGIVYYLDKAISNMPPGVETFVVIADLKGLKLKNLDPRGWLAAFDFLQAYYPERLGRVSVMHTPLIFWGAWKLVVPFIHQVTRDKIVFVEDKSLEETLLMDISKEELPTMYGGLKELVPMQDARPPTWPPSVPGV